MIVQRCGSRAPPKYNTTLKGSQATSIQLVQSGVSCKDKSENDSLIWYKGKVHPELSWCQRDKSWIKGRIDVTTRPSFP